MTTSYLIGVDLGTSSTKAALYTTNGKLIAESILEVPIYYPLPGVVEQENDDFYITAAKTVYQCIHNSGIDPRQVVAISFDSQMAGIGTIDEEFNPVTRFDSWLDMRCQPYIEYLAKHYGDVITQITGCPPTCNHGTKILWWRSERPKEYENITKFVTPAGYVAGKLANLKGDEAFIDYTFIHFSGFSDLEKGNWSNQLCDLLNIDQEKLPRIVEPWFVIGEVNDHAAVDFGLAPGTIIAAGCGDTAASALGAGIVKPGMLLDVAGTASVLATCTDTFVADVKHRALLTMRSVIPGLWHPLAYIAGGGIALRWFRDEFIGSLNKRNLDESPKLYEEFINLANSAPPGSDGLLFSPHLGGRICPATPGMRGTWSGFSWGHNLSHFARSVLESIAYEYAYYLKILHELIPNLYFFEARVVGGGGRSLVWNQIKADVLGVPYQPLKGNEFSTWGSALIAGKAAGIFQDISEIASSFAFPDGKPLKTDAKNYAIYTDYVEDYIQWQRALADFY
jgi:xylulokinase